MARRGDLGKSVHRRHHEPSFLKQSSACVVVATLAVALCLLGSTARPLQAQQRQSPGVDLSGLLGSGLVDGEFGLTTGVGAAVRTGNFVVRMLLDLHLMQPDDSGYAWQLGAGGPECRDEVTGGLVDDSHCSIARVFTGLGTDASLVLSAFGGGVHIGGGYRVGRGSTAYGLAGYEFDPGGGAWSLLLRLSAGRSLFGLQAVASLPIGAR